MASLGEKLYQSFKEERISTTSVSLWAPIKRNRLKLCSQSKKKIKVEIDGHVSELTADRSLFAHADSIEIPASC